MIDRCDIWVSSGSGGNGCVSFRREKYVPRGGPDGGDGGRGGSIILFGDSSLNTLLDFQFREKFIAEAGGDGKGKRMSGKDGSSIYLAVPLGTRIWRDGTEEPEAELLEEGKQYEVVRGGMGGKGNVRFVSSTNRVPLVGQAGELGQQAHLEMELRLLADVALIGQPNAGKSSLLAYVSRATPKAAPYPFTTLDPVLGVTEMGGRRAVVVEIPGLIRGSHQGVGLGDQFLRHAQHTSVFVHVVDGAEKDPAGAYAEVVKELELFDQDMANRPSVIALNKMDMSGTGVVADRLRSQIGSHGHKVYPISAVTGTGIRELMEGVAALLAQEETLKRPTVTWADSPVATMNQRRQNPKVHVYRGNDGSYIVDAPDAERLVRGTNLRQWNARIQLWHELRGLGVVSALERAGVESGSLVSLGETTLEWV